MTGRVELSLQSDDSKIYVSVHQATDLKIANSSSNTSNPYIRCYVTGVANREETMVSELSRCSIIATKDQGEVLMSRGRQIAIKAEWCVPLPKKRTRFSKLYSFIGVFFGLFLENKRILPNVYKSFRE